MNIVNKVKVNICGKDYSLQTDETPEYISALAARTEKQIFDLIKLKPGFGIQNASVFVALTALDEAHKAEENIENMRSQIKSSVNEAARARAAKEKAAAKIKELEARIGELEKENKELKKRTAFDCEQLVLENTVTPAVTVYAGDLADGAAEKPDNNISLEKTPTVDSRSNSDNPEKAASAERAANTDSSGKSAEEKSESQDPAQSSGKNSGDSVSSGSERKTGEKEQKGAGAAETALQKAIDDPVGGGRTAAAGNGNSPQDDNVNAPKHGGKKI